MVIAFALGTGVSIGLGVYGRLHTPSGHGVNIAGFSSGAAAKAALASSRAGPGQCPGRDGDGMMGAFCSGARGLGPCTAGRGAWRS